MKKNHDMTLTELPEFRWTLGVLLFISAVLFGVIAYNSDLVFQWDYEGFNFFVKAFSVPIAILTSVIPIVGFIALNHRSVQTKEQIELARSQNLFTNYYKHLEEFENYISSFITLPRDQIGTMHKNLYPFARQGIYNSSQFADLDTRIQKAALSFAEYLSQDGARDRKLASKALRLLDFIQIDICRALVTDLKFDDGIYAKHSKHIDNDSWAMVIESFKETSSYICRYESVLMFDQSPQKNHTYDKVKMFVYGDNPDRGEEYLIQRLQCIADENMDEFEFMETEPPM